MERCGAVVVAAGGGARFGAAGGKAFTLLAGRPVLAHSLAALDEVEQIGEMVFVLLPQDLMRFDVEIAPHLRARALRRAVAGGAERQDSVRAGLAALGPASTVVLVHDGARPLVTAGLVRRCLEALAPGIDGVVPALTIADTVKRVESDRVLSTAERDVLVSVQTPQVFRRAALEEAHRRAADAPERATDDAALIERAGGHVRWVEGDPANIKITRPADLAIAEALLAARASTAGRG